jgi:hypothetical protein
MKLLLENWREYIGEQKTGTDLVEEIWAGNYVTKVLILEDQQRLFNESIGEFFNSAYDSVKNQIQNFNNWKDNQLMSFIDASLKKLQSFFSNMHAIAVETKKETKNNILLKLFPKYRSRQIVEAFAVLRKPVYLKAGAAILAIVLQKLVELGAKTIIDTLSGGVATAAKIANFIQQNLEKIKLLIQTVISALDPDGIVSTLKDIAVAQGWIQTLIDLKRDLKDPFKSFKQGIVTA